MDNCNTNTSHLFVLSFTVGTESGIALVAANSSSQAFQILKNSGSRNCHDGSHYTLIDNRDIGMIAECNYGLLMESYVNALEAYKALLSVLDKVKGDKGDKGDNGDSGELTYLIFSLDDDGNLVYDCAEADDVADFALDNNGNLCVIL